MKKFFRMLLLPVILFAAGGCVPSGLVLREPADDPVAPAVIAALLPLSGENKIYAEQMQEGLLAAESRINMISGISGRKVKVEFFDTAGTAEGTREALLQVEKSHAIAAIAGYSTAEVSMQIRHAEKMRLPMVIPLATNDGHLEVSPFIYRNCFSDTQQMETLASYLVYWRKIQKGAAITDLTGDEQYASGITRSFTQAIADLGGASVLDIQLEPGENISANHVRSVLMTAPEFILVSARGKRAAEIIRALRSGGFHGIICGPDSWDSQELPDALSGIEPGECIFTAFFSEENNSREFRRFRSNFRKRFYHYPAACETQSYDALIFLAIALDNADDLYDFDRNWRSIKNYNGAAACYTMLKKGQIDRTIYLKSFGMEKSGSNIRVFSRLSRKLQYSKLQDYKIIE